MPPLEIPPAIDLPELAAQFRQSDTGESGPPFSVVAKRCPAGDAGDIVVCAVDPSRFRLKPLPDAAPDALPRAEWQVSDRVTIDVHVEGARIGGMTSNRAMVGLKFKF